MGGFGVDGDLARLEIVLDEDRQVAIAQFFALKEYASRLNGLYILALTAIYGRYSGYSAPP